MEKVEIFERCDENKPNKLYRLSGALLEARASGTSITSKLDELTGKPAATAPIPEESATKKELGHVLQRIEEMNEVTINLEPNFSIGWERSIVEWLHTLIPHPVQGALNFLCAVLGLLTCLLRTELVHLLEVTRIFTSFYCSG